MAAGLELLCMHREVQLARSRGDGAVVGELCQAGCKLGTVQSVVAGGSRFSGLLELDLQKA